MEETTSILNQSISSILSLTNTTCSSTESTPRHSTTNHPQTPQHCLRDINLNCVICQKYYFKPRILNCLHTFCERCLYNNINHPSPGAGDEQISGVIKCLVCSESTPMANENSVCTLPYNFFANNAIDYLMIQGQGDKAILCTACSDDADAISRCVECSEFLCMCCVTAHRRLRVTKEHKIIPLDTLRYDQSMVHRPVYCPKHKPEIFTYFCEVCQDLVCKECTILEHRGHKYERKYLFVATIKSLKSEKLLNFQ